MLYALEQGPTEQLIIKQCLQRRLPLPEAIKNAPELEIGLDIFYTAFWELNTCRPVGMGTGPIPWITILQYCKELEIEGEQREAMFEHIRKMDEVYLGHQDKKSKLKSSSNKPPIKSGKS